MNLLLRPCTLSFLKISLNQWCLAYRNWKLHLVFASLSKSLTTWPHLIHIVKIMQSIPRFEVDRENTSIKKQIVTKRHYKIHRGRWLPDQNSRPFSDPDYIWHKCHPFASTGIQNYQIILTKTFPENWNSKAPSVGTLLAYTETTA